MHHSCTSWCGSPFTNLLSPTCILGYGSRAHGILWNTHSVLWIPQVMPPLGYAIKASRSLAGVYEQASLQHPILWKPK